MSNLQELESLRATLASLQQKLAVQDADLRVAQSVLNGLQTLGGGDDAATLWRKTFDALKSALMFQAAAVLTPSEHAFLCTASTAPDLIGARWPRRPLFDHATTGQGAITPDISSIPEWAATGHQIGNADALLVPVLALDGHGLLALLGAEGRAYAPADLATASRLGLIVSQALIFTQHKQMASAIKEAELRRLAAVRTSEAKSRFFADMSHELRTPLNGVVTVAELLERTALSTAQKDMVDLIRNSGRQLEGLLNDALDFAKIESGSLKLETLSFDLTSEIADVIRLFAAKADEKGLALKVIDERTSSPLYMGDSLRIRQVVTNLLSNAIKFTAQGDVVVIISSTLEDSVWRVCISVRDTGIGFGPHGPARLFERFEQADTSITRQYGGTGLGLPISRELARMMQGDVVGRAAPDGGAWFDFTLVLQEAAAPPPSIASVIPAQKQAEPGLRILIVEDDPSSQRVTAMILDMIGATLCVADNGMQACEIMQDHCFDVILMDLQMPVMDGLTAIKTLRAREVDASPPRTPIIVVSANAMTHQVQETLDAGADAHISKPIDSGKLLAEITHVAKASLVGR